MDEHDAPRPSPRGIPRRRLLKASALLAAGSGVVASPLAGMAAGSATQPMISLASLRAQAPPGATPAGTPVPVSEYVPSALRTDEFAILTAAVDRIIPPDANSPGAADIGAQVYIDKALGGTKMTSLVSYQAGLKALDVAAGSDGFAALGPDQQDALLTMAEVEKLPGDPGGFFATLLQDTREGVFCDPIHGGNANFAGWDLMRYPGIKLNWTAEDQAIDATPKPEHISVSQYKGAQS